MYSDGNSYEEILARCLNSDVLADVDKRVGSVIYDALAPVCMELAEAYVRLDILESQTYLMTSTGDSLDSRAQDENVTRYAATKAQRIAEFYRYRTDDEGLYVYDGNGNRETEPFLPEVGSRYSLPKDSSIVFRYIGVTDGRPVVECETEGTIGNAYTGAILPLVSIPDMVSARIVDTYVGGRDKETDEELRERVRQRMNFVAFGGNIADYIGHVNAIGGVGNTKVFPSWQFNGSVLLSVVDPDFNPCTEVFLQKIKEEIDPSEHTGEGVGLAPIGHYVTVTTPVRRAVTVGVMLELIDGFTIDMVRSAVTEAVEGVLGNVRRSFDQYKERVIYRSEIISAIMKLDNIRNAKNVSINGSYDDLPFTDEARPGGQELPYLEEVVIE